MAKRFTGLLLTASLCLAGVAVADKPIDFAPEQDLLDTFEQVREQIQLLDTTDGLRNSLIAKIDQTERAYERGQPCTAANVLSALVQQARALIDARRIAEPTLLYNLVTIAYEDLLTSLPAGVDCQGHVAMAFTITIDTDLAPPMPEFPPLDGTTSRPIAAVQGENGVTASFVANELIVREDDLEFLLTGYGANVLREIDPSISGLDLPRWFVVRIDTTFAYTPDFASDITALNELSATPAQGYWRISSVEGLRLLTIAAALTLDGIPVEVNFVAWPDAIPDSTIESLGCLGCAIESPYRYEEDAYQLAYYQRGNPMDIGVADAWSLLFWSDRLTQDVPIAIIDAGFALADDLPAPITNLSIDPTQLDFLGVPSALSPWHGWSVTSTAMSLPDNNLGVAGTAGPVGRLINIYIGDGLTRGAAVAAMVQAHAAGARIANLSLHGDIPWWLGWAADAFSTVTSTLEEEGRMLFASAGNDGVNIDREICSDYLPVCWEEFFRWPCEAEGVICVGGMVGTGDWVLHDPDSAWGNSSVDIWAPFTVFALIDPNPNDYEFAHAVSGTSFSSPFAAGVAALVWSGNPQLKIGEVWELMKTTAHGPSGLRWVNAYDAVLNSGLPHTVEITHPADGSRHEKGHPVSLCGDLRQAAPAGDDLTADAKWVAQDALSESQILREATIDLVSYVDGLDRVQDCLSVDLEEGAYRIEFSATANGETAEHGIQITVENSPPQVDLYQPITGTSVCQGYAVNFRAAGSDPNESPPDHAYQWHSSRDGLLGSGPELLGVMGLSAGEHDVTITLTDSDGLSATDSVIVNVLSSDSLECSGSVGLNALIVSPESYSESGYCYPWNGVPVHVTLKADKTLNPEGATYAWSSDYDGALGEGAVIDAELNAEPTCGVPFIHTVNLAVSAPETATSASDSMLVCLATPGC